MQTNEAGDYRAAGEIDRARVGRNTDAARLADRGDLVAGDEYCLIVFGGHPRTVDEPRVGESDDGRVDGYEGPRCCVQIGTLRAERQ